MSEEVARQKPGPDPMLDNEDLQAKLLELVKLGISLRKSTFLVGIKDLKTLRHYRDTHPEFDAKLIEAEREGILHVAQVYRLCLLGKGSKVRLDAAKHFLACKDPEGFAKTDKHEITGANGGPVLTESAVTITTDLERCSREFESFARQQLGEGDVPPDGGNKSLPGEAELQPAAVPVPDVARP